MIALFDQQEARETPSRSRRADRNRRGTTLLEVQVGFAILGIGMAGLCPLVVMQLRQVRVLERRLQGQVVQYHWSSGTSNTMLTAQTYYLVPWQNPWTQKLTGAAQIVQATTIPCDPGSLTVPSSPTPQSYQVNVIELDAAPYSQSVTAYVDVSAP
jgi:hypothetical protein